MLHDTIRNHDFKRKTALQCWNNVVTIPNNIVTMLQRCVALTIVVANRLMYCTGRFSTGLKFVRLGVPFTRNQFNPCENLDA